MKKTYKEKYFELKKENEYLNIILINNDIKFNDLKTEYLEFKNDLKIKKDKEDKNFFIFSIVAMSLLIIFVIIRTFLG